MRRRESDGYNEALIEWIQQHLSQFGSAREWSLQIGSSPNLIIEVISRGRTTGDTLVKMARSVGANPADLFLKVGWLTPDDLQITGEVLTDDEREVVNLWRGLRRQERQAITQAMQALRGTDEEGARPRSGDEHRPRRRG